MVFSTTNLFKGIACPEGGTCNLTNCIYSHEVKYELAHDVKEQRSAEPAAKRRKLEYKSLADKPPSRADLIRDQLAAARQTSPATTQQDKQPVSQVAETTSPRPQSLLRSISPPSSPSSNKPSSKSTSKSLTGTVPNRRENRADAASRLAPAKVETLNPRLIPNDPAGHSKRSLILKHLHGEMARLNKGASEMRGNESQDSLVMTEQQLISAALDEEEKVARDHPTLYGNVVKQRILAFKKMPHEEWIKYGKSIHDRNQPKPPKKEAKVIETGLPLEQEHLLLPQLVADQEPLAAFGYIPAPPTAEQAAEAAAAVEASKNYEVCDRCAGRFQVFPDRNEDGLITSSGPCTFHMMRKVFPPRSKTDKETGEKQPYYPCCNEPMGTTGCTTRDEHVFKTDSPARLAAILPFIYTPENPSPAKDSRGEKVKAVTFDCEMGYTAYGLELIRLTAVSWPQGVELLDILVRPLGTIIDLNSRFSGVFPEHFATAIPYDEWDSAKALQPADQSGEKALPMVDGPQRARELLCSFLTPKTPLMGHAIENDLNTVRLCHPTIVDTMILYPHPRGLPLRYGLRMLTEKHLNRKIQTGGERGHDSLEDAVATGDLIRYKVGEKWRTLRSSGWQIVDDQLIPPSPDSKSEQSAQALTEKAIGGTARGTKRKKPPSTTGPGESGEE